MDSNSYSFLSPHEEKKFKTSLFGMIHGTRCLFDLIAVKSLLFTPR